MTGVAVAMVAVEQAVATLGIAVVIVAGVASMCGGGNGGGSPNGG